MSGYAEIAIDSFVKDTGNAGVFDYIMPEKFKDMIKIGMRVIVPFSGRNLEGYIIGIKNNTSIDLGKLKEIINIPEFEQVFTEKQLKLCRWISHEYMCSLTDSLRCIIPAGMVLKENKYIILNNPNQGFTLSMDTLERRIISEIRCSGGTIALNKLNKIIGSNTLNTVKNMVKSNIVFINSKMSQGINDKYIKCMKINDKYDDIEKTIGEMNLNRKLKQQVEMLKILKNRSSMIPLEKLIKVYGFSRSTINTLIKKNIIESVKINTLRDPFMGAVFEDSTAPILTDEQQSVIGKILNGYLTEKNRNYLIYGVTGSGKTEVYIQLIHYFVNNGKQAIMLVPEISLTPQTIERFKGRFNRVAVLHSRLSTGERYDEWKRIKSGEVDVVIGARSAVFAPLNKLGIIIIDEEHENSYKSDKTPKYHTREVAKKRCEIEDAVLVLGSATPSLETFYDASNGKYILCTMNKRVHNRDLPALEIVDMRQEIESGNRTIFSKRLYDEIKNTLSNNHQIILFLNRRGFSTFVSCRKCGYVMKCPKCDVSLTYHIDKNILNCHYCGFTTKSPNFCPKCNSSYIKFFGVGTQKIESEVKKYFPNARVLRMDLDTTSQKGSHDKIYRAFKNKDADILIGTQMITKGLDFQDVTLVGVVAADMTLNIPDYRACERTFQLITQVAGRAGRGEYEGKVIVQTYNSEHYSILSALHHDYVGFYNKEIMIRQTFNYPPFSDLVNIVVSSKIENEASSIINEITSKMKNAIRQSIDDIIILGPAPAPMYKINTYFRWQTILKGKINMDFRKQIKELIYTVSVQYKTAKIMVDLNPVSLA